MISSTASISKNSNPQQISLLISIHYFRPVQQCMHRVREEISGVNSCRPLHEPRISHRTAETASGSAVLAVAKLSFIRQVLVYSHPALPLLIKQNTVVWSWG